MNRFAQSTCYAVVICAIVLTIATTSIAQEKLRIDNDTVVVLESPWEELESRTKADLHGLHAVNHKIIWASGGNGTVIRSVDGGTSWNQFTVKDAACPDGPLLIDIHGVDEATAIAISAATPAKIYRTTNGGLRWKAMLEYPGDKVFFRSLSFWDSQRGIVMGNAIDGRMLLLRTSDGGVVWKRLREEHRPVMNAGEIGMMGGGTHMETQGDQTLVVALGGSDTGSRENSRVLISKDYCRSWVSGSVPVRRSKMGGVFSVHFSTEKDGVVIGGDSENPEFKDRIYAVTSDGGKTWGVPTPAYPPSGFRSSVARFIDDKEVKLVAVGPSGTDLSTDLGNKWRKVSEKGFRVVNFTPDGKQGFAAGNKGQIARWIPEAVKTKTPATTTAENNGRVAQ